MNTGLKLLAFATAVAASLGGAMAVGAAVGPIDVSGNDSAHSGMTSASDLPRGLAVAQSGFRLAVETGSVAADTPSSFAFRIVDDDGHPVTGFAELHERRLHLIVLSRNMVDYHHLHPTMDTTGRWTVDLPPLQAGSYRVFADFQPVGTDNITLGTDLAIAGSVDAVAMPAPAGVATVDDYTVTLTGTPAVGEEELSFEVRRDGQTVRTQPYLGAAGHLIAIRVGDLAYLHVHPVEDTETPVVTFTGEFPTAGTYRLFFDFSHDGTVRTAAFTVTVPDLDAAGH